MQPNVLDGKVAIVTGASRGIGKAIAIAYATAGAAVGCAARTASDLDATANEIKQAGGRCLTIPTDVTQREAVQHLCDITAQTYGGLDIFVINAGMNYDCRRVEESHPDDWQATLNVNLVGAYYCARAAIPYLKQHSAGKILTIGSGLGHHGRAGRSAYACSKAALWMLTRVLAQELWSYNISVNELIPGPVETLLSAQASRSEETVFSIDSEWIKTPDDVVPLALFLATQPPVGPSAQSFSLMRRDT